ncbi:MAG TPA: BatA and WFA domain-containing protein [Chloroflexota bacterium]|jgi:hypothetical protein|nr:BatA and WFA domain-containing protein [Chloroflexota bacterium]
MTFLLPLGLLAVAIPVAIYVIHWLFGSRRRIRVPALFLWADLPQASTGRTRHKLPPFSLLLLLQLLAASLAALALARPTTSSDPPRHVVLILDASASKQATDVNPSRFEAARARAVERLNALRPVEDLVTVIRAGREATLLGRGAPDTVRGALSVAQPGLTTSAIADALSLASGQIDTTPDRQGVIVLFTDGAFPQPASSGPLAAAVEVSATGGGGENQAISSLVIRMDPSGRGQTAFIEVANAADHAVRMPLRLTADGAPIDERQLDIGGRSQARLSIPLPTDAHRILAKLLGHDALALDDTFEVLAPGGPPRDVLVVGRMSDGLRRALEAVPSLRVRTATSTADQPQPDLTVLQGTLPTLLPLGPLVLLNPPASSGRLLGVGLGNGARVQPSHPLLAGLDLAALQNETPSVSGVPAWARVVLGTLQGPLIMEGKLEGRPVIALTFDPAVSGLEKSLAFPLLVGNATSYLLSQTDPQMATGATQRVDANQSDIAPRPLGPLATTRSATDTATAGNAERWPWLLAVVLALLGAEWVVYARRG